MLPFNVNYYISTWANNLVVACIVTNLGGDIELCETGPESPARAQPWPERLRSDSDMSRLRGALLVQQRPPDFHRPNW